nr:nuclear transport factor 2 family protein [Streptomyces sp. SID10815]
MCINAVIEIHGARATVRGAQLSIHVLADDSESVFLSAGHTDAALIRTADGCSISASTLRVVWPQAPGLPSATAGRFGLTLRGTGLRDHVGRPPREPLRRGWLDCPCAPKICTRRSPSASAMVTCPFAGLDLRSGAPARVHRRHGWGRGEAVRDRNLHHAGRRTAFRARRRTVARLSRPGQPNDQGA